MTAEREISRQSSRPEQRDGDASTPAAAITEGLLQRIIRETILRPTVERATLDGIEWQPLLEVAREHRDAPLSLHPVTVDLVRAVLQAFYQKHDSQPEDAWTILAPRVAQSLFDDPDAHERLDALWRRLTAQTKETDGGG